MQQKVSTLEEATGMLMPKNQGNVSETPWSFFIAVQGQDSQIYSLRDALVYHDVYNLYRS
ncbi:hypothetical protein SAMN05660236_5043 [Ohtaekwangia koreensis]|uniref:Uncharacterized protein n=1 Tax=Ohtaekwangia koreensis TaxID=688867 RepID=A0A1T5MDS0_9BACT|nr:hypothetical protein SAMN05660236_5043 [Ohtaekwangia koreensis]